MSPTPSKDSNLIIQAWRALEAGERERAQRLLAQALEQNPHEPRAWLLLAAAVDQADKRRYCLEKALALQTDNPVARQALQDLEQAQQKPAGGSVSDQQAVEEEANTPAAPAENEPGSENTTRHSARRTARQSCLVGLVVLLALISIAALASMAWPSQSGLVLAGLNLPDASTAWQSLLDGSAQLAARLEGGEGRPISGQPAPRQPVSGQPLPTVGLPRPPTWTPTTSPPPDAPATPRPTFDLLSPNGAAAVSITPFWGEWKIVIGQSAQGRPIEVFRFGSGKKERMIIAGIHGGDEWNTIALADALIEHVRRRPGLVPPGYTLYILRALNPDGEARGHNTDGRLNANGVDLNRNFDTNWKSSWRSTGCSSAPGTGGSGPGSEPETQAVKAFLSERQVEALISYHSAGLGVFPSGDPNHPGSVRLAQSIAAISDYVYPPIKTGCEYTGTLVDWASDHGVAAAVDLELNSLNETEFDANRKILELLISFGVERPTATPQPNTPAPSSSTPTR